MISFPVAFDKTFHNISYAIHFYSIVDEMITLLPKILLLIYIYIYIIILRVVQTQAILFLKSMSEKDGSEIQRL